MAPKATTTKHERQTQPAVRVTSARSFYRTSTAKKMAMVPELQDNLLLKEKECCSRATD